jgi:DNA-binding transcriptional regulator WhiA
MSYTTKIKEEIASITTTKSETIAELAGFIRNNGTVTNDSIALTSENKKTVERIKNFLKTEYEIDLKIDKKDNANFSKKELIVMYITSKVES